LGVSSPGNKLGPAFDAPQSTPWSYRKISPIGTPETQVAQSDLHKPRKEEPVPSRISVTVNQGYAQGPCQGAIDNDGAEEETGATNGEKSSMPSLVSDALRMHGDGGDDKSFGLGNENDIELINAPH
jgi:hypothetical protein